MGEVAIAQQTQMFLYALLLGGVVGVAYDCFRVTRVAFHLSWGIVLVEDLLFFTLATLLLWRYFLLESSGEVRIFAVVGMLLGWVLYFFTLGTLVMHLSGFLVKTVKRVVAAVMAPLKKGQAALHKILKSQAKVLFLGKNRLKSRIHLLYNKHKRP